MRYELGDVEIRKRARLPHWDTQHGIYFVTFNLFDSLPSGVRLRIQEEADGQLAHIRALRGVVTPAERQAIEHWKQAKLGDELDQSHGQCWMRTPAVASLVADALIFFDGDRYNLLTWCVMPNHVHVVMTLTDALDAVIHSWKSFTSKAANRLLRRSGHFWQSDYFDRCIRDSADLQRTVEYVLENPLNAGLVAWP